MESKKELIAYRLQRAKETLEDAEILAEHQKWNSCINRLYYACFYAVTALLLENNFKAITHNGVKSVFSENFIKNNIIHKDLGKIYSRLFTWRQKGDYDDLFDFSEEKVLPYLEPAKKLISTIEQEINK